MGSPEAQGKPALCQFKSLLIPTRPGARVHLRSDRYDGRRLVHHHLGLAPQMTVTRAPSLAEVIRRHIEQAADELHTCLPGVVTVWDAATQRADVKPLIRHAWLDEADARQVESLAVCTGVPVQFMAAGGFALTCPISTGANGLGPATTGTLFFSEASLDRWLSGTGAEVDPEIDHRHTLSDGIFVPGLNPFSAPLAGIPTDHAFLGAVNGVGIHLRAGIICVGDEAGSDFVALAAKVATQLDALKTAFTTWTPVPGDGGAVLKGLLTTLIGTGWPASTAAAQAKGK